MAISVSSKTTTSISVSCSYPSGTSITRTKMYRDGTYVGDGSASNNFSYTFSGLSPDTSYNLSVQWFAGTGGTTELGVNSTGSVSTNKPRPSNFSWSYSNISSGAIARVDSRDWNNLASKINAFRTFKGLSTYSFTSASPGGDILAWMFNQLVSGSNGLTPYMSNNVIPYTVYSGETFYASYLRNIVTSINSVN